MFRAEPAKDAQRAVVSARDLSRQADGVVAVDVGEHKDQIRPDDQSPEAGRRRFARDHAGVGGELVPSPVRPPA